MSGVERLMELLRIKIRRTKPGSPPIELNPVRLVKSVANYKARKGITRAEFLGLSTASALSLFGLNVLFRLFSPSLEGQLDQNQRLSTYTQAGEILVDSETLPVLSATSIQSLVEQANRFSDLLSDSTLGLINSLLDKITHPATASEIAKSLVVADNSRLNTREPNLFAQFIAISANQKLLLRFVHGASQAPETVRISDELSLGLGLPLSKPTLTNEDFLIMLVKELFSLVTYDTLCRAFYHLGSADLTQVSLTDSQGSNIIGLFRELTIGHYLIDSSLSGGTPENRLNVYYYTDVVGILLMTASLMESRLLAHQMKHDFYSSTAYDYLQKNPQTLATCHTLIGAIASNQNRLEPTDKNRDLVLALQIPAVQLGKLLYQ